MQRKRKAAKKARAEALKEGRQEGRQEMAIAIARELLDVLDLETISEKTGLSLAELQTLQAQASSVDRQT